MSVYRSLLPILAYSCLLVYTILENSLAVNAQECSKWKCDKAIKEGNLNNQAKFCCDTLITKSASFKCEDTKESFRINNSYPNAICSDLKLEKLNYVCKKRPTIASGCPETCGLCNSCRDSSGFIAESGFTCADVFKATNRSWRCKQEDTKKHCPFTCNACSDCSNKPGKPLNGGITCNKLSFKSGQELGTICKKSKYAKHCPETCNTCPCIDKEGTPFQDKTLLSCNKINKKKDCFNSIYKEHCPETCGTCQEPIGNRTNGGRPRTNHETPEPSVQPSFKPSTQPSVQPSAKPSVQPSAQPSVQPSDNPSMTPSKLPTSKPSSKPSIVVTSPCIGIGCGIVLPPCTGTGCGIVPPPCTGTGCGIVPPPCTGTGCGGLVPGVGCTGGGCGTTSTCLGQGPTCMSHACYHPELKCTTACGNYQLMHSLECRCKNDPSVMCDPYVCPNSMCKFCTYWCKLHTPYDYNHYCPLAPWGKTIHASLVPGHSFRHLSDKKKDSQ